jgi:hypothetical protein
MKRESGPHHRPREARLLPASAHVFPGIPPGVWIQAATMADIDWTKGVQRAEGWWTELRRRAAGRLRSEGG